MQYGPTRMSSRTSSCSEIDFIISARISMSISRYMAIWMVVMYMSWKRVAICDLTRSSGVLGISCVGSRSAYLSARYCKMHSLSGIDEPSGRTMRGIFPCGFSAQYSEDLSPPSSVGGRISISSSRPFRYISIRTRAPLFDTGTSNKVGFSNWGTSALLRCDELRGSVKFMLCIITLVLRFEERQVLVRVRVTRLRFAVEQAKLERCWVYVANCIFEVVEVLIICPF
mmetsp:Transcript_10251/g.24466  ORF Transcript_10251/g.24466 Transcript_10251/m.24466 type:complete len:227 (-) Transcript_10251:58-738(-)